MKAILFEQFGQPPLLTTVADPTPASTGVVLQVEASGLCRSDWHGWMGHDSSISLPHVPGHELAGVVVATGSQVRKWQAGDRVTVPFICACGECEYCQAGDQQVCPQQTQPGFTHWGSFAEYVAIERADENLVAIPETLSSVTAASLGCRFATAFRGVVDQGKLRPGQWLAVHGCGGVGLSAIMIGKALGGQVIAVDPDLNRLKKARQLGADLVIPVQSQSQVIAEIREQTCGGAHVSLDALGSTVTCVQSLECLRKRGKHLQIGLMLAEHARPAIPLGRLIAEELEILGCHGMQAHRYPAMLQLISEQNLQPELLIGKTISLSEAPQELMSMALFPGSGVTVITEFTL